MIHTYRTIGKYIVEYEQWWAERAEYGQWLLKKLSADLTTQFGKGFSVQNIQYFRQSFTFFPKYQSLIGTFTNLSWTHYIRLMSIKDEHERSFYAIETHTNNRSVRELNRQFDSGLYLRLALSRDKDKIQELATKGHIIQTAEDVFKEPYVLEFLGLDEKSEYTESQLEQAIIDYVERFLLELGKGFAFVGRQQRITNWAKHYFVDLVFYHRFLRCFVLIDLKLGKLDHSDLWQMQLYVNWYDEHVRQEWEHQTIWLVLCRENDHFLLTYALPKDNEQIYAKEYQTYLPDRKKLEDHLTQYVQQLEETR